MQPLESQFFKHKILSYKRKKPPIVGINPTIKVITVTTAKEAPVALKHVILQSSKSPRNNITNESVKLRSIVLLIPFKNNYKCKYLRLLKRTKVMA